MKTQTAAIELDLSWQLLGWALLCAFVMLIPDVHAYSYQNSDVGNYICWVADNFEGNAGRGIATIGISTIGILALLGRVTWTQAMIVGVGCAVLFGAPNIIISLGANTNCP